LPEGLARGLGTRASGSFYIPLNASKTLRIARLGARTGKKRYRVVYLPLSESILRKKRGIPKKREDLPFGGR